MATKYKGKLVYAGKGRLGVIEDYYYHEGKISIDEPAEKWVIRICKSHDTVTVISKPTIINSVKYVLGERTIFVELKIKNQFYPGYAILSPNDTKDNSFGKRLALARAMGDAEGITSLLDENWHRLLGRICRRRTPDKDEDAEETTTVEDAKYNDGVVVDENVENYTPAEGDGEVVVDKFAF
jgi:hypothetical protein